MVVVTFCCDFFSLCFWKDDSPNNAYWKEGVVVVVVVVVGVLVIAVVVAEVASMSIQFFYEAVLIKII